MPKNEALTLMPMKSRANVISDEIANEISDEISPR